MSLIISAQNLIQSFVVALYEKKFGESEFLRLIFVNEYSPIIGLILVAIGLLYNLLATVGLEWADSLKNAIPKKPEFSLEILDMDENILPLDFRMRGLKILNNLKDYPEFYIPRPNSFFGNTNISLLDSRANEDLYKERAEFLELWSGAEVLSFNIKNVSSVSATNLEVKIHCKKLTSLAMDNGNSFTPKLPAKEKRGLLDFHRHDFNLASKLDIDDSHTHSKYIFTWKLGSLVAQRNRLSETKIFMRTEEAFELSVMIYCEELSEPIEIIYQISPPDSQHTLTTDDLYDEKFDELINTSVMDGYIERYRKVIVDNYLNPSKGNLVP
ncbi:MAG TPA: hypothetical protein PLP67_09175 [Methylotenera sp.]|nr:hypothetical protein [Methylotenera sp.]